MNFIFSAIEKKDYVSYKELIQSIPIQKMDYEQSTNLLYELLKRIEKSNFVDGLKYTLRLWGGLECGFDDFEGEIYPILPTLFLSDSIPFYILHYIMDSLREVVTVEEVAIELMEKGSGDKLRNGLKNLFDMLGQPSGEMYRILSEEAINSGNEIAIEFFSGLQSYYTNQVETPKYIIEGDDVFEERDLLELATEISEEICGTSLNSNEIEDCVEIVMKGFENHGLEVMDINTTRKLLYHKFSKMAQENLVKYIRNFISEQYRESLMEDMSLFNILGPANPRMDCEEWICQKFGGCRMLYCSCLEHHLTDPETGEKSCNEWFKGKCDKCSRKISKKCYAVRKPLSNGGWIGTYCSWNCLYLSGDVEDELVMRYEKEVNERKIMNRVEICVPDL